MLVRDLIELLREVPQELPVVSAGMEVRGVRVGTLQEAEAVKANPLQHSPGALVLAERFSKGFVSLKRHEFGETVLPPEDKNALR
jgi:hypothetical protein